MKSIFYILFHLHFLCISCTKIKLIIDTDADMDDIFAISYILSNENFFDVKLITTTHKYIKQPELGIAKLLKELRKTNIPIGIGLNASETSFYSSNFHTKWLEDFNVENYEGEIYKNGLEKFQSIINDSTEDDPVHILAIAPLSNIACLLQKDPLLADKIKIYLTGGSINKGYHGEKQVTEQNISTNLTASQIVFNQKFKLQDIILTPLDSSSFLQIHDDNYRQFLHYAEIGCKPASIILNYYKLWFEEYGLASEKFSIIPFDPYTSTSNLYDVMTAISLKYFSDFYKLENDIHLVYTPMMLYVDDFGQTIRTQDNKENYQTFVVAEGFPHDVHNDIDILCKEILKSILLPCVIQKNDSQ